MKTAVELDRPVTEFLTNSAVTLREAWTVDEALAALRAKGGGGGEAGGVASSQVIYFYVVNEREQLVGVLPSRRLILAAGGARVGEMMIREVIALSPKETLFEALELFAMHRLLAIPVVNAERKLLGVVEISLYTDEVFDLAKNQQLNEVFQLMGLRLEQHKQGGGGAWRGFKLRMPWLVSNIVGGLACAALGSLFESTVQKVVVVALFIPLILTLAESVAVQSMTLAIEAAASGKRQKGGDWAGVAREILTAILLGVCSGAIVGCVSLFWHAPRAAPLTIAGAVVVTMVLAAVLGRLLPGVIYRLRLNPRIASGPVTLAVVDVCTVFLYLLGAMVVLGR